MRVGAVLLLLWPLLANASAGLPSEEPPLSSFTIAVAEGASDVELHAAEVLHNWTNLPVTTNATFHRGRLSGDRLLAIGAAAGQALLGSVDVPSLGLEGFASGWAEIAAPSEWVFVVTGGSEDGARGVLYGVYALLEELGWRFLTPEVTAVPENPVFPHHKHRPSLVETPIFEYREMDSMPAVGQAHQEWAAGAMRFNGEAFDGVDGHGGSVTTFDKPGGGVRFAVPPGPVHTSFTLVDPALNMTYPEWFSEDVTQLCWANDSLVQYVTARVKECLDADPTATLISVSQNDNKDYCNRSADWAVIQEEGSPMGPLLRAVNTIADAIRDTHPSVAVHTLAYQYTRQPPTQTVPRDNVCIQLCSIECSWAVPLNHPDNAAFMADLLNWNNVSDRIYIWDYVVDFANFIMPWPNYGVLIENLRIFAQHGVKGVFEEADYVANGGDLAELKTYLVAKAMWDPAAATPVQVERHTWDFLSGFYSAAAAPEIRRYMSVFQSAVNATAFYLGESVPYTSDYLFPTAVLEGARALEAARRLAPAGPERSRCDVASLTVRYVTLLRWEEMVAFAESSHMEWPFPETDKQSFYDTFRTIYLANGLDQSTKDPPEDSALSEWGHGLEWLCETANVTNCAHL